MKIISFLLLFILLLLGCSSITNDTSTSSRQLKVINSNDTTLIPINHTLSLAFSMPIEVSTLSLESLYLLDSTGQKEELELEILTNILVNIKPKLFLKANENYTLVVTKELKSSSGFGLLEPYEWKFTTGISLDTDAPKLLAVLPKDADAVDKFTTVALQFDELLVTDTFQNLQLTMADTNQSVEGKSIEVGSSLRFIPSDALTIGQSYRLSLSLPIMDKARNHYTGESVWDFVVGDGLEYNQSINTYKSTLALNANINTMYTKDNLLYVCATNTLFIVSMDEDKRLKLDTTIKLDADIYDIAFSEELIALATDKGITLMDASTHKTVKTFNTDAPVYGISYANNVFYAGASSAGIYIFSATQETLEVMPITGVAFDILVNDDALFVAQYLDGVSEYTLSGEFVQNYATQTLTRSLTLYNNILYVASSTQGVSMIDLLAGNTQTFASLAFAMNLVIYEDKIYVADKERGISVFDIPTSSRIAQIQEKNSADVYAVSIINDMLVSVTKEGLLSTRSPIVFQDITPSIPIVEESNNSKPIGPTEESNNSESIEPTEESNNSEPIEPTEESNNSEPIEPTEEENTTIEVDRTAPTILSIRPIAGDEYNGTAVIIFDEDINLSSITNDTASLFATNRDDVECFGYDIENIDYNNSSYTATIYYREFSHNLIECNNLLSQNYELTVSDITDKAGNTMLTPVHSLFVILAPLKVEELNATAVEKIDMDVFVTFNRDVNAGIIENVNLMRTDSFGCFEHLLQDINYTSKRTATMRYKANLISGIGCKQAMTLDFNISIEDGKGEILTEPHSRIHLRIEDTTPPQVISTLPIDGYDAGYEYNGMISVIFDEDMDASSITNANVGLYGWRVNEVSEICEAYSIGTVSYDSTSKTATIDYPEPLSGMYNLDFSCEENKFEIRIKDVKDSAGNRLSLPVNTDFYAGMVY